MPPKAQKPEVVNLTQREHVLHRPDTYIGTVRYSEVERLVARFSASSRPPSSVEASATARSRTNSTASSVASAPAAAAVGGKDTVEAEEDIAEGVDEVDADVAEEFEQAASVSTAAAAAPKTKKLKPANPAIEIFEKTIQFCPGLVQCFMEILNNARDRTVASGTEVRCTRIEVSYNQATGEITVMNNGDGVSTVLHSSGAHIPEMVFGRLLTSTNYDDNERRIVGGRNGFGAKLTNIYSSRFTIETVDAHTRQKYVQTWTGNMANVSLPVITDGVKSRPYTKVSWIFDHARFGKTNVIDDDFIGVMLKATVDVAATVGNKITVLFQGQEVACDTLLKYLDVFPELANSTQKLHAVVNDRWKIAVVGVQSDVGGRTHSFVNGMWTPQGGTHESLVVNQVVEAIAGTLRTRAKGADAKLLEACRNLTRQIKDRLWIFVDACIENPEFTSQTKECLKSPVREFGSTCELPPAFVRKLAGLEVVEQIMDGLRGKSQAALKSTDGRKVNNITGVPKLDDAPWAGTKNSEKCILVITEGDSAKATAVAGLSARKDRERFGIWPLRGKILNVTNASPLDLGKTEGEFFFLKKILGLQQGKTYETEAERKNLRYGKLVIFTDQDTDGFHIKALVMNIFARFWPHLLRSGFVQSLPTPILKLTKGKQVLPFFTVPDYKAWLERNDPAGWKVKYYKGLGTSTKDEAMDYFKTLNLVEYVERPRTSIQTFFGAASAGAGGAAAVVLPAGPPAGAFEETTTLFTNMFSKDRTDYRKEWVMSFNPDDFLDPKRREVTLTDFIHKEYKQHADDNLRRTTPSVVDGLKPGQRKILFGCFKEGLDNPKKEMKVAQLGAAVAKETQYHHGEQSLMASIVNMAQNFVGSNNLNLLEPLGQFGTRLEGGADAASPRYIFTRISTEATYVFRTEDNPILEYLEEDGQSIEPVEYLPIIPMVLVNGAEGIGTGFSTKLPPTHPMFVISNVRAMVQAHGSTDGLSRYLPYWNKFHGRVWTDVADGKFVVEGTCEPEGHGRYHITELPIGVWSTPYKAHLEDLQTQGKIVEFEWLVDDERIDVHVQLPQAVAELSGIDALSHALELEAGDRAAVATEKKRKAVSDAADFSHEDLERMLKLKAKVSINNVHLYTTGKASHIKKYGTIAEVYSDFYVARHAGYVKRKQYILSNLERDLRVAQARATFIQAKLDGRLVLENRPDEDVDADLASMGLPLGHELGISATGYDYLLNMPLKSLTRTKVADLNATVEKLNHKIAVTRATTVEHMWLEELRELECKLAGTPFVPSEVVPQAQAQAPSAAEAEAMEVDDDDAPTPRKQFRRVAARPIVNA
jgi:DNA topoisomerase-2